MDAWALLWCFFGGVCVLFQRVGCETTLGYWLRMDVSLMQFMIHTVAWHVSSTAAAKGQHKPQNWILNTSLTTNMCAADILLAHNQANVGESIHALCCKEEKLSELGFLYKRHYMNEGRTTHFSQRRRLMSHVGDACSCPTCFMAPPESWFFFIYILYIWAFVH